MSTTNVTYGVTTTVIGGYLAQVGIGGANDALDATDVTTLVQHAASQLNSSLVVAGLGSVLADINAATTSVAYQNCQRLVCYLLLPVIVSSVWGGGAVQTAVEMKQTAVAELAAIRKNPDLLGWDDSLTQPALTSTVTFLGLDLSDATVNQNRRLWDEDDEHCVIW